MSEGQSRPDTRSRGHTLIHNDGFVYSCFNCKIKFGWKPGHYLSDSIQRVFKIIGIDDQTISRLILESWRLKDSIIADITKETDDKFNANILKRTPKALPEFARSFSEWLLLDEPPLEFIECFDYLMSRDENLFQWFDFYWSPEDDFKKKIIIPFWMDGTIWGYTARTIENSKHRYYSKHPPNFLFNSDVASIESRKFIILVEGVFDAIAIDGIASLKSEVNQDQINWLNETKKVIIVLPDRDQAGKNLVNIALKHDWSVSFPLNWDKDIKDASDAVGRYGRLFALKSIIDSNSNAPAVIEINKAKWFS